MAQDIGTRNPREQFEAWIEKNSDWLALAIIVAAFALRLAFAYGCYLNPDEAAHFESARPSSWLGAYKAAFFLTHPPLFPLVLHGFLFLGRSELVLRLPSLLGGTAALWLTYAWIHRHLGAIPALAGLGFMALSPAAISASTEVRQYGLLLFFVSGALYATERASSTRFAVWAIVQGVFLLGATLTHYTAIVVLVSVGCYVLIRSLIDEVPRQSIFIFCLSSLALAMVECWLYFGHVRGTIRFGPGSSLDYLHLYYYARPHETPLASSWRALSGTFSYFGSHRTAPLFMLTFLVGLSAYATGRTKAPRFMTLLVLSPFVVGFAAHIFQLFPFAGSRHQDYLLPFFAATISAAFACLPRRLAVLGLFAGVVLAPWWVTRVRPDNDPRIMPRSDMAAAVAYLEATVPSGAPIYIDYQTHQVLWYYFTRNDKNLDNLTLAAKGRAPLGGHPVVVPGDAWDFRPDEVLEQVAASARELGVRPYDPVWLVSLAWSTGGELPSLAARLPADKNRQSREFGQISVIRVIAPGH